jgi:hypothetical protein
MFDVATSTTPVTHTPIMLMHIAAHQNFVPISAASDRFPNAFSWRFTYDSMAASPISLATRAEDPREYSF